MAAVGVSVDNLDKLLRAMRKENLIDGPIRRGMEDLGKMAVGRARAASPKASGAMAGGWEHKVAATSVSISNRTKRTRGKRAPFNYPKRQEFGPGKNNGKVRQAVRSGPVQSTISKMAKDIEKRFAVG